MLSQRAIQKIDLPRKNTTKSLNIVCEQSNATQYSLNSPQFDPDQESSPPNSFMQNLHERMNTYHCKTK